MDEKIRQIIRQYDYNSIKKLTLPKKWAVGIPTSTKEPTFVYGIPIDVGERLKVITKYYE